MNSLTVIFLTRCLVSVTDTAEEDEPAVHNESVVPNEPGRYQLKYNVSSNSAFLDHENWLVKTIAALEGLPISSADTRMVMRTFLCKIWDELEKISTAKSDEWRRQRENVGAPFEERKARNDEGQIIIDTSKHLSY